MDGYLKQSTASQVRTVGPFVDDTDFKTLENGLTIANTDIIIKKNGAASGSKNSGGATADTAGGLYHLTWDATDTATVGELAYSIKVAGALVVFGKYVVLEEAVYDALFAASAAGYQVPIWAAANSTVNLSATTVKAVTDAVALPSSATIAITGNITGNLSGSVGSVTGAVGSVTGAVGSVTAGVTVTTNNDKTGYALSATGSAALTEDYAADGAAFTLNQAVYMIWSMLAERSISSTTLTAGKLDGTTAAMTFTLDDAVTPNSQTRAT